MNSIYTESSYFASLENKNNFYYRKRRLFTQTAVKLCAFSTTIIIAIILITLPSKPYISIFYFVSILILMIWLTMDDVDLVTFTNNLSLFFTIALFILLPFHFSISHRFAFYRELFDFFYISLIVIYFKLKSFSFITHYVFRAIFIWILYLIFCYIIDPEVSIYHEDILMASEQLSRFSPKMYTLRNLLLYLPLLFLLFYRGLSRKEFLLLLTIIVCISPFSIILFHQNRDVYTFSEFNNLLNSKGHGLAYNTYTPYVTFPFIAGLYLFVSFKKKFLKTLSLFIVLFDFSYIVYSTSRQSIFYCVIAFSFLMFLQRQKKFLPFLLLIIPAYYVMTSSDILISRYFSENVFSTGRIKLILEGVQKLNGLDDWLIGKGLSSVVHSGPHNNYVRFIQRIGLIGTVLTFLPFFYGLVQILGDIKCYRHNKGFDTNLAWFLALALFFPLYHSNFGYPHEEVYNTPYVWLGLSLWLTTKRKITLRRHKKIVKQE